MSVFTRLVVTEFRLALREPLYGFFTLLFPVALVAILGLVPSFREPTADLGGLRVIDVYAGITITLTIAILGLQSMPSVLATYREKGILRRLATTPVQPALLLGAQLVMSLITVLASTVLVYTVAGLAYDVPIPEHPLGFLIAVVLSTAGVFAVGLLVAAVAPSGKTANAVGTLLFFPLMFFAGLWTPREVMPAIAQRISDFTPLGAGERLMHDAATGQWPNLLSVTVLVAYLLLFGAAATKFFRWE
jgi:ABC-2 type transport system permease protein